MQYLIFGTKNHISKISWTLIYVKELLCFYWGYLYRQFSNVNLKKIKTTQQPTNLLYRYYYLKPLFSDKEGNGLYCYINKFKVSTFKETCVGTWHFINNVSQTIFFLSKLLKTMRCGFHFGPQTTFIAKLRTGFFFLWKKGLSFQIYTNSKRFTVGTVLRSKQLKKSLHELLVP